MNRPPAPGAARGVRGRAEARRKPDAGGGPAPAGADPASDRPRDPPAGADPASDRPRDPPAGANPASDRPRDPPERLTDQAAIILHATTVAFAAGAVLILGPSGSGKSALGLQLIWLGARLVADDQTVVQCRAGTLVASAPAEIRGMIEARGVGILAASPQDEAVLALVVDLGTKETERLPPFRNWTMAGCSLPLLHSIRRSHFPVAIAQYILSGRRA